MKKLPILLISAIFAFAGCKKDNKETEPANPATLEEAQSLIVGKWKLIKGVSKYSLRSDTTYTYTRAWNDSLYQEYSKDSFFEEYKVVNGQNQYMYALAYGVLDSPINYLSNPNKYKDYKYHLDLFIRPQTEFRQILKLTKSTLITIHDQPLNPGPQGPNFDTETIMLELERVY